MRDVVEEDRREENRHCKAFQDNTGTLAFTLSILF